MAEERAITERSLELLDVLKIGHRRDDQAKGLPYGDQRRLEIARALATEPRLLLLDEPTAGMNPRETDTLTELIGLLRRELSLSVLLIEHGMAKEALAAFAATKAKEPNRYRGFAGAAQAAELAGDAARAKDNYQKLIALAASGDSERPELAAARRYVAEH